MAPDLNSVPPSPRPHASQTAATSLTPQRSTTSSRHSSTPVSRRASQISHMGPPPLPLASPGGALPTATQHLHAFPPLSPQLPSVDAGGAPMRHPRPLTAAELHVELEKEQEAVVNRLTRELNNLRAHSASVASTTSSTSAVLLDNTEHTPGTHPTSARRHRSSSSVSRSSMSAYAGISLTSATAGIPHHRYSVSSQPAGLDAGTRGSSVVSTPRYEEVAAYRVEMEEAKRENEGLKVRVRELERLIKGGVEERRGRERELALRDGVAEGGAV